MARGRTTHKEEAASETTDLADQVTDWADRTLDAAEAHDWAAPEDRETESGEATLADATEETTSEASPWDVVKPEAIETVGKKLRFVPESIIVAARKSVAGDPQAWAIEGWTDENIAQLRKYIVDAGAHVEKTLRAVDQMHKGKRMVAIRVVARRPRKTRSVANVTDSTEVPERVTDEVAIGSGEL